MCAGKEENEINRPALPHFNEVGGRSRCFAAGLLPPEVGLVKCGRRCAGLAKKNCDAECHSIFSNQQLVGQVMCHAIPCKTEKQGTDVEATPVNEVSGVNGLALQRQRYPKRE